MKKFNKIISMLYVLGLFSFCFCARAVKFERIGVVREDAWKSVSHLRDEAIATACKKKIKTLRELLKRCSARTEIPALAGTYMERCGILQESYTVEQLKRSGNIDDFRYNVNQIIRIYQDVKKEYSCSALPSRETVDEHKSMQHLDKCPQRKGQYSTCGRSRRGGFR